MIGVLHSGGIDSTAVMQYYLNQGERVQPIVVNYGQIMASTEIHQSKAIAKYLKVSPPVILDIKSVKELIPLHPLMSGKTKPQKSFKQDFRSQFFPNRNLLLLSVASIYCYQKNISEMALGIISGGNTGYADTGKPFLKMANKMFFDSVGINILAPLITWNKQRVVKYLTSHHIDINITFSCNTRSKSHCGQCASCIERKIAMSALK